MTKLITSFFSMYFSHKQKTQKKGQSCSSLMPTNLVLSRLTHEKNTKFYTTKNLHTNLFFAVIPIFIFLHVQSNDNVTL